MGDTNIYFLRILSIASEVLSYLQMFEEAADYAKKMVDGYLYVCALFLTLPGCAALGSVLQERFSQSAPIRAVVLAFGEAPGCVTRWRGIPS